MIYLTLMVGDIGDSPTSGDDGEYYCRISGGGGGGGDFEG